MFKATASKVFFVAWDNGTSTFKTGDTANISCFISKDGGASVAMSAPALAELDATKAPGVYVATVSATEATADVIVFSATSTTANITIDPITIYTKLTLAAIVAGIYPSADGSLPQTGDAAKLSYLNLTNAVLRRADLQTISTVASQTGNPRVVVDAINQAQNAIFAAGNWHSLYKTTTFATVSGTATYAKPSNFGRMISMMDATNNKMLVPDITFGMDLDDPDNNSSSKPLSYAIEAGNFRLNPIPDGAYTIRERYYSTPSTLSLDAHQSDLPIWCENCLIEYAYYVLLIALNKFEAARNAKENFTALLDLAKQAESMAISNQNGQRG